MKKNRKPETGAEELLFVPLGGTGEIGMNLYLYGYGPPDRHAWLMVDCGITFADDSTPGVDVILPDPGFIEAHRDRLVGLVVTHAHEDHLGAIPYLWRRFQCPVYATPFAAAFLKRKLAEERMADTVPIHVVPLGGKFTVGPFGVEMVTLTHSIPEPNGVALHTPLGTVFHTGDWKFDPDPVIGPNADEVALKRLGDDGVLVLVGDSTNVFTKGSTPSEASLKKSLTELIGRCEGRVAVACFASNVARLRTIHEAARANHRRTALVGRSLRRIDATARDTGYLDNLPEFLEEEDLGYLMDHEAVMICTGSQGEPQSALARIAKNEHPNVELGGGDTVIFSSRVIPGNERAVGRMQNALVGRGIEVITERDAFVHVSGHPARDDLIKMYKLIRPKVAVPIHGELRHLHEHAKLAEKCGVPTVVEPEDGTVLRFAPGPVEAVDHVPTGRLMVEGNRLLNLEGDLHRGRKRVLFNGMAVATVVLDEDGHLLADPKLTTQGLLEDEVESDIAEDIVDAIAAAVKDMPKKHRRDDSAVEEVVRQAVRRGFRDAVGKKPVTQVHLVRV